MGDAPTFVIKGEVRAFMVGEGMGDAPTFVINGDAPLAKHVSFAFIIGDAHSECTSLICQRSGRVSNINLTEMHQKIDRLLLLSTEPVPILANAGASHFFRLKTIAFVRVFDLHVRFEFLT
jgi:hypothetical protein